MKFRWLPVFLALAFVAAVLLAPGAISVSAQEGVEAAAAAEEFGGEAGAEEGGLLALVMRWINFAILFGGLGYLLRQPVAEFFETRRQQILGGLEKSRAAQNDATRRIADIDGRLASLATEIAAIGVDADKSAHKERERIVADAKKEVGRALHRSEVEVDRVSGVMEAEIRAQIADHVVREAEEKLRSRMTDQDHGRLVRRAVEGL